jgi:transposase InsO family protein
MVPEVTPAADAAGDLLPIEVPAVPTNPCDVNTASTAAGVDRLGQRFQDECRRGEAEHLHRVQSLIQARVDEQTQPRRRGPAWQQAKRRVQEDVRQQTVACYHQLRGYGYRLEEVAELFQLSPRRLRHWDQRCRPEPIAVTPPPLGRPTARAPRAARQAVLQALQDEGPGLGVPSLRLLFPDLTRAELSDLLQRYRRILRRRYGHSPRVLHWLVPGRVWAIDFAEPSLRGATSSLPPIDGCFPYLLAVRDLASGLQFAWLPVRDATAAQTCAVLAQLFASYGVPLVLKADNGPPFRADETKQFLGHLGVAILFSPPYWPGYNGAIEAAIGSLKRRTEQYAAAQSRSGRWTADDADAALQQANAGRPRRLKGQTPAQVWAGRSALTDHERASFAATVAHQRNLARLEMNLAAGCDLDHWQASAVDRHAIERALVEHGYLLFRRRRIPLTITPGKVTFFA